MPPKIQAFGIDTSVFIEEQEVLTDYHAKDFAHELSKRCASGSLGKLEGDAFRWTDNFV